MNTQVIHLNKEVGTLSGGDSIYDTRERIKADSLADIVTNKYPIVMALNKSPGAVLMNVNILSELSSNGTEASAVVYLPGQSGVGPVSARLIKGSAETLTSVSGIDPELLYVCIRI